MLKIVFNGLFLLTAMAMMLEFVGLSGWVVRVRHTHLDRLWHLNMHLPEAHQF